MYGKRTAVLYRFGGHLCGHFATQELHKLCRVDKGGSKKSREGRHGESNRLYAYEVSLERKESNMSYDPAHRK